MTSPSTPSGSLTVNDLIFAIGQKEVELLYLRALVERLRGASADPDPKPDPEPEPEPAGFPERARVNGLPEQS